MSGEAASLRERVLASASRVVGAPERSHFLRLLAAADGYRLDAAAAASLSATLAARPLTVERNLDLVRLPARGVWVEYPDAPRRPPGVAPLPGARHPADVGMLACPDPGDDDKVVMLAAWDFEPAGAGGEPGRASVRHSYAAVAFSRGDVSRHAYEARALPAARQGEALERILSLMHPYLPAGLGEELLLMADVPEGDAAGRERAEGAAMRDVTSEAPFALAALLLLSSEGASHPAAGAGEPVVGLPPRRPFARIRGALLGDGFVRRGRPAAPRLGYLPPAA